MIDVVHATDHTNHAAYETEIALIKVACSVEERTEVLQISEHFGAKVVDYGTQSLMLRVFGGSEKLDALIALLEPFDLVELVRSGKVLMARGATMT
jgi:acetolactate synthase small subunit